MIAACHERDVPAMPGCFSPTEILAAHECGADIVKVFPATMLGPQFIKDVRAPLPQVKLMPTGGVTLDNAGDWIRAGAVAVGLGSALLDAKAIDERPLRRHHRECAQSGREYRGGAGVSGLARSVARGFSRATRRSPKGFALRVDGIGVPPLALDM